MLSQNIQIMGLPEELVQNERHSWTIGLDPETYGKSRSSLFNSTDSNFAMVVQAKFTGVY